MSKDKPQPGWYKVEPGHKIGRFAWGEKLSDKPLAEGAKIPVVMWDYGGQSGSRVLTVGPDNQAAVFDCTFDEYYGMLIAAKVKPITPDQAADDPSINKKVRYKA